MEPIRCRTCDGLFTPRQARTIYCSRACYWESLKRPKEDGVQYRMRTVKGHPIAPNSGVVAVARLNLYEKIGPGPHPCNWCGTPIDWKPNDPYAPDALIADHLDWHTDDDSPDNLTPSCNPCNSHRRSGGHSARIGSDDQTVVWSGAKTRAIERVCEGCGTRFLIPPSATKRGRGRFCSRSCARKQSRAK
jgi:hypothetical protein